jgi:hypothetical protein
MNALARLGDVPVAFGIFFYCFAQRSYYLVSSFPSFSNFQHQLTSFYSTLIHIFKRLLRLGSLECLDARLVCRQAFLPISRSGIGLVFMEVIAPTTYLKN